MYMYIYVYICIYMHIYIYVCMLDLALRRPASDLWSVCRSSPHHFRADAFSMAKASAQQTIREVISGHSSGFGLGLTLYIHVCVCKQLSALPKHKWEDVRLPAVAGIIYIYIYIYMYIYIYIYIYIF